VLKVLKVLGMLKVRRWCLRGRVSAGF